ncbi:hypothetical protein [Micromonospora sp. NBRC 101691]|uniref:hypothetical protein n=1 Tax=Micromonospora sp. NBRC 101691 TaxID=3032198 RepID=UPI0025545D98|nr:hypothetical protein [Micromonospora sp. NBRC 101691]
MSLPGARGAQINFNSGNAQTNIYVSPMSWVLMALALALALSAVVGLFVVLTPDDTGRTATPSPSVTSTPATKPSIASAGARSPGQWAKDVDATCARMSDKLAGHVRAMAAIDTDKVESNDPAEIGKLAETLKRYHDDYADLAARLREIPPPSYSAEEARKWLELFDVRGRGLYNASQKVDSSSAFDRLQASYETARYSGRSDEILSRAQQLGISSCP